MTTINTFISCFESTRARTLNLLGRVAELPDPSAALAWLPGPSRAHVAWQLMHVGVTEDIFATERLMPEKPPLFGELWPRFRGGSTPDNDIPSLDAIRDCLTRSRAHLIETLGDYRDEQLPDIPPGLAQRGWTFLHVLHTIVWHESHHHGQAHITLNLYEAHR